MRISISHCLKQSSASVNCFSHSFTKDTTNYTIKKQATSVIGTTLRDQLVGTSEKRSDLRYIDITHIRHGYLNFEEILDNGKWIQSGILAPRTFTLKLDLQQFSMVQNAGIDIICGSLCIEEKNSSISEADLALLSSDKETSENEENAVESEKEELLQSEKEETSEDEPESEKIEVILIDLADCSVGTPTCHNEGQY